jgi:hypothetical protein
MESFDPVHFVLDATLTVFGPNSDQLFSCELGKICELAIRGNLVNESSVILVAPSTFCGSSTSYLDLPGLLNQPFKGINTVNIGLPTRSPDIFVYRVCWTSKTRSLDPQDFRVDIGNLEFRGPVRLSTTATCVIGEQTSCSISLSSPGYLRISDSPDCGMPAKLRLKAGSGGNPVHSDNGDYYFGSIRGGDIHRDLALCWGSDGEEFPVFVGNFRLSLPRCSEGLIIAIASNNPVNAEALLRVETEPLCEITDGSTSLHGVVVRGWLTAVTALVDRGANFDQTDISGETSIFVAITSPEVTDVFLATFIMQTACDLRIPSARSGFTLVHAALSAGRSEFLMSEIMPRLGRVSLEVPDPRYGSSPVIWAAQTGDNEVLAALLRRGVDGSTVDFRGRSPLHFLAMNGNSEGVQILLRYCCPVSACLSLEDNLKLKPRDVAKTNEVKFWLDEYASDTQGCAKRGL